MKVQTSVNGVNVEKMAQTIELLGKDPSLATFRFRGRNEWIDGGHNRTKCQDFYGAGQEDPSRAEPFVLEADEPVVLLGADLGANPVEHLLHALASCMTTSIVYHAAARGITIESLESTLEGELDLRGFLGMRSDVRPGFHRIKASFRVKSDAPVEQVRELCNFSPVFDMVTNRVPVLVEMSAE